MAGGLAGSSRGLFLSPIGGLGIGPTCNSVHGCYTIVPGLDTNPTACLATRGPNGTVIGNYPVSHQRRGVHIHAGYPMISGFNTVLPPNSPNCSNGWAEISWGIFPPASYHPGGVNLSMADGSIRFSPNRFSSRAHWWLAMKSVVTGSAYRPCRPAFSP